MSSENILRPVPRRVRKASPSAPVVAVSVTRRAKKSVPFIPHHPKDDRAPEQAKKTVGDSAQTAARQQIRAGRSRRANKPSRSGALRKPPRVRRRLKPGGLFRLIRRFRIAVAVVLALSAAAAALLAGERSEMEMATVVRVTSDVVSGDILNASVLEQAEIDAEAVPDHYSADIHDMLGQTAAVALPAGAVVHPTHLVGPGLLTGHEPGTVAVPVRPADTAIIGLLSPGQRVDVTVSADGPESEGGSRRIAEAAPVLWIPQDESENWLGATSDSKNVVILAVDSVTAAEIAESTSSGRLHLTVVSPAG
ncbi:Flp pilus assembly protein CpaB [Nesterenkonia salmonea]|nr:RcpC/CpaB family pilus assembly protein [Nesterenkonia salmonea]